jgi:hypothetical protein
VTGIGAHKENALQLETKKVALQDMHSLLPSPLSTQTTSSEEAQESGYLLKN